MKRYLVTGFDISDISRDLILRLLEIGNVVYTAVSENYDGRYNYTYNKYITEEKLFIKTVDYVDEESLDKFIGNFNDVVLDGIINCHAKIALDDKGDLIHEFLNFDYKEFKDVLNYNVLSIAKLCIDLKSRIVKKGCIINISSTAANDGAFATVSYNSTKAAIINLSKSLANNFGLYNEIRVNVVSPGWIPQNKDVVAGGIVELSNKMTPISEIGCTSNTTDAIVSILNNDFINNINMQVDGGLSSNYLMYLMEDYNIKNNINTGQVQIINALNECVSKKKND